MVDIVGGWFGRYEHGQCCGLSESSNDNLQAESVAHFWLLLLSRPNVILAASASVYAHLIACTPVRPPVARWLLGWSASGRQQCRLAADVASPVGKGEGGSR